MIALVEEVINISFIEKGMSPNGISTYINPEYPQVEIQIIIR